MGKKSTKQTQTMTPNAPSWTSPQVESLTGQVTDLAGQDPTQFIAPANGLLTRAGQAAEGLTFDPTAYQSANGVFQGLMDTAAPQMKAAGLLDGGLDKYMSPYLQDVVDTSLASYDDDANSQLAAAKLAQAADTTFGGSGGYAQLGKLQAGISLGRGQLSAGLYDQGFGQATNLANLDADRVQAARAANLSAQNANLDRQAQSGRDIVDTASRYYGDQAGLIGTKIAAGTPLQQIDQATAGAPVSVLQQLIAAYGGLTPAQGLLTGQTTTGKTTSSSGLGGVLSGLGTLALGLGTGGLGFGLGGLAGLGSAAGGLTGAANLTNYA